MRAADDDDEKNDLIGRKTDLIIKGSGVEMSSSEWKKPATTARTIEQQRIKNIRTNSAMLHNFTKLVPHDDLFLLGMDWVGKLHFKWVDLFLSQTKMKYYRFRWCNVYSYTSI